MSDRWCVSTLMRFASTYGTGKSLTAGEPPEKRTFGSPGLLAARLAERGIKTILTPIAWWGNGWPEPDELTSGFSQGYSRLELVTNQHAREAQRRYLKQFVEHRNHYRKTAYADDPSIIALEIINEPITRQMTMQPRSTSTRWRESSVMPGLRSDFLQHQRELE